MAEKQDTYARTSVLDSLTGDVWTYQRGAGVPSELPVARHDSPTAAQFDAMPTGTASLRALLLKQAKEQQAQAIAEQQKELKARGKNAVIRQPHLTDDDLVFEQATTLLWNPLVGPELRSALYKVLAATPGVRVDSHARDDLGRACRGDQPDRHRDRNRGPDLREPEDGRRARDGLRLPGRHQGHRPVPVGDQPRHRAPNPYRR